jgi:folate-dependent phosphoribosylglycinamide formyltransferase PurN
LVKGRETEEVRSISLYQLGWFSTGRDKAAGDLLQAVQDSIERGEMKAEIAFVFSNREPGESESSDRFFELVGSYHIPLITLSYQRFKAEQGATANKQEVTLPEWREEYDRAVMERLKGFRPELCVLAGYMLIVDKEMCRHYDMVNLHPAAPGGPTGTWQEVIRRLIRDGADKTGVMMHLVTPELDKGPAVTYATFPIRGSPFDRYWTEIEGRPLTVTERQGEDSPLFRLIREHGLKREFLLIIATLKAFSLGRVRIREGKVTDSGGRPLNGYNLSEEIDRIAGEDRVLKGGEVD